MLSSLELPEVYGLTGTILFVILSIFTAIFDEHYPKGTPYLYQAAALAGFGQLLYGSMNSHMQTRVLLNLSYVVFSLANVTGLFVWLLYKRREVSSLLRYVYFFLIVLPANFTVAFLYFGYLQPAPFPLFTLPPEVFPGLLVISVSLLLVGALATYKPDSLRVIMRIANLKVKLNNKIRKR